MSSLPIDYEDLLRRYMAHIGLIEGIDYLADGQIAHSKRHGVAFSEEEIEVDPSVRTTGSGFLVGSSTVLFC